MTGGMNEELKTSDITKEQMLADGWKFIEQPDVILFEKEIENRNPINNSPEDTDIKLIVHSYLGQWKFGVLFPDGGILNFVANSMKQLKEFENKIDFYDCPY